MQNVPKIVRERLQAAHARRQSPRCGRADGLRRAFAARPRTSRRARASGPLRRLPRHRGLGFTRDRASRNCHRPIPQRMADLASASLGICGGRRRRHSLVRGPAISAASAASNHGPEVIRSDLKLLPRRPGSGRRQSHRLLPPLRSGTKLQSPAAPAFEDSVDSKDKDADVNEKKSVARAEASTRSVPCRRSVAVAARAWPATVRCPTVPGWRTVAAAKHRAEPGSHGPRHLQRWRSRRPRVASCPRICAFPFPARLQEVEGGRRPAIGRKSHSERESDPGPACGAAAIRRREQGRQSQAARGC